MVEDDQDGAEESKMAATSNSGGRFPLINSVLFGNLNNVKQSDKLQSCQQKTANRSNDWGDKGDHQNDPMSAETGQDGRLTSHLESWFDNDSKQTGEANLASNNLASEQNHCDDGQGNYYFEQDANKLQLSDNEVEIDENSNEFKIDSLLETNFSVMYNDDEDKPSPGLSKIVDLSFASIHKHLKTDVSEQLDFVILFIYLNNVHQKDHEFDKDSLTINFTSDDPSLRKFHHYDDSDNSNLVYRLAILLRNSIQPQFSNVKVSAKKIEIKFVKADRSKAWGSVGEMCLLSFFELLPSAKPLPSLEASFNGTANLNEWKPLVSPSSSSSQAMVLFDNQQDDAKDAKANGGKGRFFGYTGLTNIGNTCFLNSVLQCLVNADSLKDYFLANEHLGDINHQNPIGHGGIIAKSFAQIVHTLWSGSMSSFTPSKLKHIIGEKVTATFLGFGQHDAQEFMSFLLDAIHEDLNRVQNKPKVISNDESEDEDLSLFDDSEAITETKLVARRKRLLEKSNEMWKQYKLFNDSIIIDLFCGQFKSILTCPDCHKKSITFDPFLYVPLPIPTKYSYDVIYFARDAATGLCKGAYKYNLSFFQNATVSHLCQLVSHKTNVPVAKMRVLQAQDDGILPKILNPNWLLLDYNVHNVFSSSLRSLLLFESNKDDEDHVELCVVQRTLSDFIQPNIVSLPFLVSLKRSMLTYSYLSTVLCSYAAYSVSVERHSARKPTSLHKSPPIANQANFNLSQYLDIFNLNRNEDKCNVSVITPQVVEEKNLPNLLYYKCEPQTINDYIAPFVLRKANCSTIKGNGDDEDDHIAPPVRPRNQRRASNDKFPQTLSVAQLEPKKDKSDDEELNDEEDGEDQDVEEMETDEDDDIEYDSHALLELESVFYINLDWICSTKLPAHVSVRVNRCMSNINTVHMAENACDNEVTLAQCLQAFSEPEVLGPQNCWRCPSCKVLREATKQLSFWRLPSHLVIQLKRFRMRNVIARDKLNTAVKYPLEGLDLECLQSQYGLFDHDGKKMSKPIYDLFGVVNHYGSPFGGHYTAYARCFKEKLGWRCFDDSIVEPLDEKDVVNSSAYLLFYRLRDHSKGLNGG